LLSCKRFFYRRPNFHVCVEVLWFRTTLYYTLIVVKKFTIFVNIFYQINRRAYDNPIHSVLS
jgi:hypothetical protein